VAGQIRLVGLRPTPLDVAEVLAAVVDDAAGGLALFVGTVRDHDEGKAVTALGYSAHPHAEVQLREVAERVVRNHPVVALAAVHRVGQPDGGHVVLCWLALLLIRLAEHATGDTWRNLRHQLDRLHLGTFTGPAGTIRQRTELTAGQRSILHALDLPDPPRFVHLDAANG